MRFILAIVGAALLAYPVFAAVGLGLSLCVFFGLLCLMGSIYLWFVDTAENTYAVAQRVDDNHFMLERLLK